MEYIKADEALWASSMLPEGILERWFIASGDAVRAGDRIAEIRVEDALHEIVSPAAGRATIVAAANAVIEPGPDLREAGDASRRQLRAPLNHSLKSVATADPTPRRLAAPPTGCVLLGGG